jgi:two-component system OmpR family response regulator
VRLLIVEDDERTSRYLIRGLSESGHVVDHAADGETGLALASEGIYDALIIDRRLPILDGIAVVRRLRERDTITPVLMLSAIGAMADRVEGMRAGCDDYLAKPYAFAELLARLEALARRADRTRRSTMLRVGDLVLDTRARIASRNGTELHLQNRELLLLEKLMRHSGQVVTRSMLLEAAWDYAFEPRGNIIDMHMHRLRQKIDHGFTPPLIHTILGAGYMVRDDSDPRETPPEPARRTTRPDSPNGPKQP